MMAFQLLFYVFQQIKTVSIVSEETKKELKKMIAQNKELDSLLSKTRSDSNAKVRHKDLVVPHLYGQVGDFVVNCPISLSVGDWHYQCRNVLYYTRA